MIKTDSDQGHLAATMNSVEFREEMWAKGVYMLLGLPNSTSVSQEMDQLYQTFKARCRVKILSLFSNKLVERSKLITKYKEELKCLKYEHQDLQDP